MKSDLSTTISETRDAANRRAADLAEQARDWWDRGSHLAQAQADAVRLQAHRMTRSTERYLRDEPVKSAMAAMALGALVAGVAWWIARRRL
jgi:ElaB/YqjD/DUF883 family membrane-anchored ribosome-binding protein